MAADKITGTMHWNDREQGPGPSDSPNDSTLRVPLTVRWPTTARDIQALSAIIKPALQARNDPNAEYYYAFVRIEAVPRTYLSVYEKDPVLKDAKWWLVAYGYKKPKASDPYAMDAWWRRVTAMSGGKHRKP